MNGRDFCEILADEVNMDYDVCRGLYKGFCNTVEENLLCGFDVCIDKIGRLKVKEGKLCFKPSILLQDKLKEVYKAV